MGIRERFPRDYSGDILANTWVGFIHNPQKWLTDCAEIEGFTPKRNPYLMSPREQQEAVANTICRNREAWRSGVAVNFEYGGERDTLCFVAFHSAWLKSWTTMKYQHFHNAHFEVALGTLEELYWRLENGAQGRTVITPIFYKGIAVRDNTEIMVEATPKAIAKGDTLVFSSQKSLCTGQLFG